MTLANPTRRFNPLELWIARLELWRSKELMIAQISRLRVVTPGYDLLNCDIEMHYTDVVNVYCFTFSGPSMSANIEVGNISNSVNLQVQDQ